MIATRPQTLTFLFTDIEGSTPLWDRHPAAMAAATERHNAILRDAIAAHSGDAFRVVGDAFCVAFARAHDAVTAAMDAQRALRAEPWGDASIHVRMGLHSGTVDTAAEEVFRGPTLARAARVMSAAHGDQILATAATVALLEGNIPRGAVLRDLGDHTLRGFARPERIYQLVVGGLRAEFPPIVTQDALHTNLPRALTSFVGRAQALGEVRNAVQAAPLATLIGPGGTGKTRLALEAAGTLLEDFADGVWLVELAQVADPALVARAIVDALGARAEGDIEPLTLITASLRGKRALLVLDNCEHVIDEAAALAQSLIQALPQLHLLATSREALGLAGEVVLRVPSMRLPPVEQDVSAAAVAATEAGTLFVERARAVVPAFALTDDNAAAVARICRRLDGIPLAIELATARLAALSVHELAQRVDDRFRLLTGGVRTALPRQRTLRALIDWSYDLLGSDERYVLDTLAVFTGGFTLAAAEAVCAPEAVAGLGVLDALERLVAKSMIAVEHQPGADTRYRLLETMRQYAGDRLLARGDADAARQRHCAHFVAQARRGAEAFYGPVALEWLDRLELDQDNFRAALDWAAHAAPVEHARLAGLLSGYWDTRGYFTEGVERLERALRSHVNSDHTRLAALIGAGLLAFRLDRTQQSDALLSEGLELATALGDRRAECQALLYLATDRLWQGAGAAEPLASRALEIARAERHVVLEGHALLLLGRVAEWRGDHAQARATFLQSTQRFEQSGCVLRVPLALQMAGEAALELQDFGEARRLLDQALLGHRRMGNVHDAASTLRLLAVIDHQEGALSRAQERCSESVRMFRELHDANCGALAEIAHAQIALGAGQPDIARAAAQSALDVFTGWGLSTRMSLAYELLARANAALGDCEGERRALQLAVEDLQRPRRERWLPGVLEAIAACNPAHADAPVLLGCATALRAEARLAVLPAERAVRDARLARVRAAHGDAAFESALARGRDVAPADALARAAGMLAT